MAEINNADMFEKMYELQKQFIELLHRRRGYPSSPIDSSTKEGQRFCKSLVYEIMGELFEAVQHLKNSKQHRAADIPDIDKDELTEELVDAQHFFLELLVYLDITPQQFYESFITKNKINQNRIEKGY